MDSRRGTFNCCLEICACDSPALSHLSPVYLTLSSSFDGGHLWSWVTSPLAALPDWFPRLASFLAMIYHLCISSAGYRSSAFVLLGSLVAIALSVPSADSSLVTFLWLTAWLNTGWLGTEVLKRCLNVSPPTLVAWKSFICNVPSILGPINTSGIWTPGNLDVLHIVSTAWWNHLK